MPKIIDLTNADKVGKVYLVDSLMVNKGFTREDANKAVEGVFDAVVTALLADTAVAFSNIGTIRPMEIGPRVRRNPKTGENFDAPAATIVKWKSSPTLLDLINHRIERPSLTAKAPKGTFSR